MDKIWLTALELSISPALPHQQLSPDLETGCHILSPVTDFYEAAKLAAKVGSLVEDSMIRE